MKTLPIEKCVLIGHDSQNEPFFFGKKDSSDPESRDLSLWITKGIPLVDGSNYHRVAPEAEQAYISGKFTVHGWVEHLREHYNLS
jgi:hypothetical protein